MKLSKSSYLSLLSRRWRMLAVLLCNLAALAIAAASPSVSASLSPAVHSKAVSMPYEEVYADGTIRQITAPDAPANPPRQPLVDPTPDPYLEPGFPLYTDPTGGSYMAGPAINTLVGNIDSDPTLEILATGLATGPLYAWNSDGSLEPGWPVPDLDGAAYPALGELSASTQGLEVFSGDIGMWPANGRLFAYTGGGLRMPGWPKDSANYVPEPASLIDVNSDGLDEIFLGEEDMKLHAYLADGSILPGWPVFDWMHGQRRNTPTLADLDGDGQPDIVTAAGAITPGGVSIFAYHADATPVAGWPVQLSESVEGSTFPMMGDVDGDGSLEMVVMTSVNYVAELRVYASDGTLKRSWPVLLGADNLVPTPVLADLDGDRIPEIIYQAAGSAFAWRGDGTPFPGWPVQWSESEWVTNGLPVVGDVDGDGQPDIVMESSVYNSSVLGYLRIYNRFGVPLPGFPREMDLGAGGVPAIADIDGDGRNEVIVRGTAWDGGYTWYPSIWAFDLHGTGPYGRIEWGQFSEDPEHHGVYQPRTCTSTFEDVLPGSTFYPYVICLVNQGIISGYSNCTFRPNNNVTRGQLAKIVSNAAGFNEPVGAQQYQDVVPGSTFFDYIWRLSDRGIISGYPCGGPSEPCGPGNLPYFRAGNNASRGQITKIISNAAGFGDTPTGQQFEDVAAGSTYYTYAYRLVIRDIMSGYPCGGEGEPCGPGNLPYFRPSSDATRGQTSKIVANTFFPNCQTSKQ